MPDPFVWFQNLSSDPSKTVQFYEGLLGWASSEAPGGSMFSGERGPFAGVAPEDKPVGWVPYAQVADVDDATDRALRLGGQLVKARTKGPAGEFTIVRDPGGAVIALWQKAA